MLDYYNYLLSDKKKTRQSTKLLHCVSPSNQNIAISLLVTLIYNQLFVYRLSDTYNT